MSSADVRVPTRVRKTSEKYLSGGARGSVKAVTKMRTRFSSYQGNRLGWKSVSIAGRTVPAGGMLLFVTPEDLAHLRRARDLMDREYARPLDVPAMARAALMSPAHFSRQFRAAYGETPYGYLMTRRIERAKALLRLGTMSVTEVCVEVGCTSLGSFSARFTSLVGETPSAYRARTHDALAAVPGCHLKGLTRPSRFGEASRGRRT